MARRKDHTPKELKEMIRDAAHKIIVTKGVRHLTARPLAQEVGYTPGTIYNFYRDMDAIISEVNYKTLGNLEISLKERTAYLPPNFLKIKALAYAYVDFAHENVRAWESIFLRTRKNGKSVHLPVRYKNKVTDLFELIECTIIECFNVSKPEAMRSARLLWACLHGITVLTLDGRLKLFGIEKPHKTIDNLLEKYFALYVKKQNSSCGGARPRNILNQKKS